MLKFIFDKQRVVVDPLTIQIAGLKAIWDNDTSKTKNEATKFLTYIHLVSQLDESAPYYTSSYNEVRPLAKKDIFGDYEFEFQEDVEEMLEEVIEEYQKAFEPVEKRSLRIFTMKIDQIRETIEATTPTIKESTRMGTVSFASNFPLLDKMMQGLGPLMDTKDEMQARLRKEKSEDATVRGNKKLSMIEQRLKKVKEANAIGNDVEGEIDPDTINSY
jgi:hypothetical protein